MLPFFPSGPTRGEDVNPHTIFPVLPRLFCCLPLKYRNKLCCGVRDPVEVRSAAVQAGSGVYWDCGTSKSSPKGTASLCGLHMHILLKGCWSQSPLELAASLRPTSRGESAPPSGETTVSHSLCGGFRQPVSFPDLGTGGACYASSAIPSD